MDATVVQEIANQLGMAVDATSEWLSATLPLYAGYRTTVAVAWIVISAVVVVVALLAATMLYHHTKATIACKNENYKTYDWWDYPVAYISVIVLVILAAIFLIPLLINIDTLVRWSFFPEGATLDMVLKAVR